MVGPPVVPAKAGIQGLKVPAVAPDPRVRRGDEQAFLRAHSGSPARQPFAETGIAYNDADYLMIDAAPVRARASFAHLQILPRVSSARQDFTSRQA